MWSSFCSSRCTCPRTMTDYRLISMQLVHTIFQACKQQHHFQMHINIACDACNIITDIAPVPPPAMNTNPDANDAAARSARACPRPVGYVVQLLLVALYMSTYDE
jgi:hypothetical protein